MEREVKREMGHVERKGGKDEGREERERGKEGEESKIPPVQSC